jgi:hypothetical protein
LLTLPRRRGADSTGHVEPQSGSQVR